MIIDSIGNTRICEKTHPLFKRVFEYIKATDFSLLPNGRVEPEGESFFVLLSQNEGKSKDAAPVEAHRKYIDIQIILEGEETMGWLPLSKCLNPQGDFDAGNDIVFFNDKPCSYITLHPGEYVVFFPCDGHAPGVGTGTIRKAVVKVPV